MKNYAQFEECKASVELIHMFGWFKWEKTAPPPGKFAVKGEVLMENSQQARLQHLLQGFAALNPDHIYQTLSVHTRRRDRQSPISTGSRWMKQPLPLNERWFLEACISLRQKKTIVEQLTLVGISDQTIACAKDFVAGLSIATHLPADIVELCMKAEEENMPFPTVRVLAAGDVSHSNA